MSRFQPATKTAIKLRAALFGPAGAGKTMSAIRIARGLVGDAGRIAVIDTESNSSRRYADRWTFDQLNLVDPTVADYVQAIDEAAAAGYDALVIDSLSHGWKWLTQEVEQIARAKFRGNTWSAWSEGTPIWDSLTRAILRFNAGGHVLATMQSKTEWITADQGSGKKAPQRVGLSPTAGKGIEYEFDVLLEMTPDHLANVIKDRTGRFQDRILDRPGESFGQELAEWLGDGAPPAQAPAPAPSPGPSVDETLAKIAAASAAALDKLAGRLAAREKAGDVTGTDANRIRKAIDDRRSTLAEAANANA